MVSLRSQTLDIVSRSVLALYIPSPFVIVTVVMDAVVGSWSGPLVRRLRSRYILVLPSFLKLVLLYGFDGLLYINQISLLEDIDSESAHMVARSKVLMLRSKVLMLKPENGNTAPKITVVEGVEKVIPPTTVEEKAHKRLEVKTRSALMIGIPNEHQLKFNSIKDAKLLLEAIERCLVGMLLQIKLKEIS
ncbi:hypothetical protein Tco_1429258 [Tanacetum coccineum]